MEVTYIDVALWAVRGAVALLCLVCVAGPAIAFVRLVKKNQGWGK